MSESAKDAFRRFSGLAKRLLAIPKRELKRERARYAVKRKTRKHKRIYTADSSASRKNDSSSRSVE